VTAPTPGPPEAPEPPRFDVMNGYLVEHVGGCTCVGGGEWPHESHCGWEPLVPVEELIKQIKALRQVLDGWPLDAARKWLADIATARAAAAAPDTTHEGDPS
jgi:hypothetical protein